MHIFVYIWVFALFVAMSLSDHMRSRQQRQKELTEYRRMYQTIKKRLVKKVQSGGKVGKKENEEMHRYKFLAASMAREIELENALKKIREVSSATSGVSTKRRAQIPWPEHPAAMKPSVLLTEVVDLMGLKAAVLSVRVLSGSSEGEWMHDALHRAFGEDYDKHRVSCRATLLIAATTGSPIDNQHAKLSPLVAPSYSKVKVAIERSGTQHLDYCTILNSEGYAQVVCAVETLGVCSSLVEEKFEATLSNYLHRDLYELPEDTLHFTGAVHKRRRTTETRKQGSVAVVAHLGARSLETSLQLEMFYRFHRSRGYTPIIYDRYGLHREIMKQSMRPTEGVPRPPPRETTRLVIEEHQALMTMRRVTAQKPPLNRGSISWAKPAPINDAQAYLARRQRRGQHKLTYYNLPAPLTHNTAANFRNEPFHNAAKGSLSSTPSVLYHAFTPYEIVRRTISTKGRLYVPYMDKPMAMMLAVHEYGWLFERVVLLDVDEFLDCVDSWVNVTVRAGTKGIDELRIPRRSVNTTVGLEKCYQMSETDGKNGDGPCTFPDLWGSAFKWQKFSKVAVLPYNVPDVTIHGSETPGFNNLDLPMNHVVTNNLPAWDCSVEHLNARYFGTQVKTRSIIKPFEAYRGPHHWGLTDLDTSKYGSPPLSVRSSLYPPLRDMAAFSIFANGAVDDENVFQIAKRNARCGSGYDLATGGMRLATVADLPASTREQLRPDEFTT